MANKNKSNRNKTKIYLLILAVALALNITFFSGNVFGEEKGEVANIDWNDPSQLVSNFNNNPEKAWEAIEKNPDLLANQAVLNKVFSNSNDAAKAAKIINSNLALLDKQNVQNKFDEAVAGNLALLNDNPDAKSALLSRKYSLAMEDKNLEIKSYDGKKMTTGGENGGTFSMEAIKGRNAQIMKDGSLLIKNTKISKAQDLSVSTEPSGREFFRMTGGEAEVSRNAKINLNVKNGRAQVKRDYTYSPRKAIKVQEGFVDYEGSFTVEKGIEIGPPSTKGDLITGKEGEFKRTFGYIYKVIETGEIKTQRTAAFNIKGKILEPAGLPNNKPSKIIMLEKTALTKTDGTSISANTNKMVEYIYDHQKDSAKFCRKSVSCIIDAPPHLGTIKGYASRLAFLDVQNNDKISVSSPTFYSHVEVIDQKNGEVIFTSTDEQGRRLAAVKSVSKEKPKLIGGQMEYLKAGRFDAVYNKDKACSGESCEKILQHWSSNRFQKDQTYFTKKRDSFVTCTIDKDCERKFAESFGKIIPQNKKPTTTIIIGGDNAFTAKSLEGYCEKAGCYILNSRDTPSKTESSNLIITGHHFVYDDFIWRDPPERGSGIHEPIDQLAFNCKPFASPFACLPKGNVNTVAFSSCSSIIEEDYAGFAELRKKYSGINGLQGWTGTADLEDGMQGGPIFKKAEIQKDEKPEGQRAWYFKNSDGSWIWTNGETERKVKLR